VRAAVLLCSLAWSGCSDGGSRSPEASRDAGASQGALDASRADAQGPAPAQRDAESALCVPLAQSGDCTEEPGEPLEDAGAPELSGDASVTCDTRKVLCKRAPPVCAEGQFPAVVESCWGACVRFDRCVCHAAAECPQPEQYTCHMSAAHCGPFVN
jgi:hypothetical protein